MKKIISCSLILGLALFSCKKEESKDNSNIQETLTIPETQKATVFYFGGTWSDQSGTNGRLAVQAIKELAPKNSVIISCYLNSNNFVDPMNNAVADELSSGFLVESVPYLIIGSAGQPFESVKSSSLMAQYAVDEVNKAAGRELVTNCNVSISETNGLVKAKVRGKFFTDAAGEFHLAAYLLESRLNHGQVSDNSKEKNIHNDVLRAKFGASITGELIKLDPKKGDIYEKEISFSLPASGLYKKENCSIAIVIWQNTSSGWFISNSNVVKVQP